MFKDIMDETRKRLIEDAELQHSVEVERAKIQEKRANSKKSIVRQIDIIDKIGDKIDTKMDQKQLESFEESSRKSIEAARKARRAEFLANNLETMIIAGAVVVGLIIALCVIGKIMH